ncbi:hypothetical protein DRQ50_02985 [bacterium]|nr:MAG: hypothetical protein DRQ50_02985 [bacterium]
MDFIQDRRVSRRSAPPARPRIVSVGNLAVGGTGKTPVVIQLALDLAAAGHCGCVLTRGYGSGLAGPLQVDPADELAGDEARMMAALLQPTGWPVVQSRRRRDGVQWIRRHLDEVDLVLLEDGHQTPIGRHLDVLIVDTWHDDLGGLAVRTGPVMPFGPWRESARGARRADLLLLEAQAPPATSTTGQPVTGFVRRLVLDPAPVTGAPWAALSGVARPLRFEEDATAVLGRPPELAIRCDDHSGYGAALLNRITGALRAAGAPCTVTTRKDWTKLAPSWPEDLPVIVADQDLSWTGKQTLPAMVGERLDNR